MEKQKEEQEKRIKELEEKMSKYNLEKERLRNTQTDGEQRKFLWVMLTAFSPIVKQMP